MINFLTVFHSNYRPSANDDLICMLWKTYIGFQVDHTVSTIYDKT